MNCTRPATWIPALVFLLVSTLTGSLFAQSDAFEYEWEPQWQAPETRTHYGDHPQELTYFPCTDCSWDESIPNLPVHIENLRVPEGKVLVVDSVRFELGILEQESYSGMIWDLSSVSPSHPALLQNKKDFILGPVTIDGGKRYQKLTVYPFFISDRKFEKRRGSRTFYFSYADAPQTAILTGTQTANKTAEFPRASKLSTGVWHRVSLNKEGVYRIDHALLRELGLDPSQIDPRKFGVFGRTGGMLPQENNIAAGDDLNENAIAFVGDESDGRWNENDYFVFYAQGPNEVWLDANGVFRYQNHIYDSQSYFYISATAGTGKRVATQDMPAAGSTDRVDQFTYLDEDKTNLTSMGRIWFGDDFQFGTTRNYKFPIYDAVGGDSARVNVRAAGRSGQSTTLGVSLNGRTQAGIRFNSISMLCFYCTHAHLSSQAYFVPAHQLGSELNIGLNYDHGSQSNAWVESLSLEYRQRPTWRNEAYSFWLKANLFTDKTQYITIAQGRNDLWLWEVSNATSVAAHRLQSDAGTLGFVASREKHNRFWLFDPAQAVSPKAEGPVANQNLHASGPVDYVIFTPEAWKDQAERLAEFHRRNYTSLAGGPRRVLVATDNQVYHEFSSGTKDMTAFRNMLRMFYERANGDSTQQPQFALMFGDGSYDNREIETKGAVLLTYPARNSLYPPEAFTSDDYIGFMDPAEGFWGEGTNFFPGDNRTEAYGMEIAIGRLPVNNVDEALAMVDKLIRYATDPESFGPWRSRTLLLADFKMNGPYSFEANHMKESNSLDREYISPCSPCTEVDKLFLDSYPSEQTALGQRYPEAARDLIDKIHQGQLIINYTGHGGETGLSNSYIFEMKDIEALRNRNRLAFWVTATCDFGRYDDPERRSGAEALIINPEGGAIGMMTSVREVFSNGNEALNRNFFREIYGCDATSRQPLGTSMLKAKNRTYTNHPINTRNFALLCDPGLSLVQPTMQAAVTQINNQPFDEARAPDTLRALSRMDVAGEIRNTDGSLASDFSGELDVTVFDKDQNMTTIVAKYDYTWQKNRLFKGRATVTDGKFKFTFIVPLDISYEIGAGHINLYAKSLKSDAMGCTDHLVVCCTDPNASACTNRPEIQLSINDRYWRDGGLTHPNPLIIADLSDELGINSTGTGVGRELTGILDGNENEPIRLTPYYEGVLDNHRKGYVEYQLQNLAPGDHTLELTAWNVCNLSSRRQVRFRVGNPEEVELVDVKVYPNPARDQVTFFFSHNLAGEDIRATVRIFDMQGRVVQEITGQYNSPSSLSNEMTWDGTTSGGGPVAAGLYMYRLTVEAASRGISNESHGKLILQP